MGRIYCLMGKSASGKDTVYEKVRALCPELRSYVMYSTRPMREGEKDGVTYHFVDPGFLLQAEKDGKLIEERTYHTVKGPWLYATVDDGSLDPSRSSYLMPATPESFQKLRDYFGRDRVVPIYLEVEDGERLYRAILREREQKVPQYREMCRRFLSDCEDFSEEKLREAGIGRRFYNSDPELCAKEIAELICLEMKESDSRS